MVSYLGYTQPEIKSNPLEWWKQHFKEFPYEEFLSVLAKKYPIPQCMCNQLPLQESIQHEWKYVLLQPNATTYSQIR